MKEIPEEYYKTGKKEIENRNFDKAIENFSKAIDLKKDYVEAYCNRGILYSEKGNINEALLNYNKALEINPNFILALYNRGVAFGRLKKFTEALNDYYGVIEIANDRNLITETYKNIGFIYMTLDEFKKCIITFKKLTELNPDISKYYWLKAKCHTKTEEYEKAIEDLNTAIELDSDNDTYYADRGYNYFSIKQFEKTISDYTKISNNFQHILFVKRILGYSFAYTGKEELALKNFKEVLKAMPDDEKIKEQIEKILKLQKEEQKRNNIHSDLTKHLVSGNKQATSSDEIPEGIGEFGLTVTNPVPVKGLANNRIYLDKLRTVEGAAIEYERLGSTKTQNIEKPIDIYKIFINDIFITKVYISPYHKKTSMKAPKGFQLIS